MVWNPAMFSYIFIRMILWLDGVIVTITIVHIRKFIIFFRCMQISLDPGSFVECLKILPGCLQISMNFAKVPAFNSDNDHHGQGRSQRGCGRYRTAPTCSLSANLSWYLPYLCHFQPPFCWKVWGILLANSEPAPPKDILFFAPDEWWLQEQHSEISLCNVYGLLILEENRCNWINFKHEIFSFCQEIWKPRENNIVQNYWTILPISVK